MKTKMSTNQFIKKAKKIHRSKYNYDLTKYVDYYQKIAIKCNKCLKIFSPTPSNHLLGSGCPTCNTNRQRMTQKEFLQKAKKVHNNNFNYSSSNYIDAKTKVKIICNECQRYFWQLPRGHIYEEQGCPFCKISHGEKKIMKFLDKNNIKYKHQYRFKNCKGRRQTLPFDFFIPSISLCIEFDGKQHFDKTSKYYSEELIKNDSIKTNYCKNKNIQLLRISYKKINILEKILTSNLSQLGYTL